MNRTDVPNLFGKIVRLVGLKTKELNSEIGRAIVWNNETERFGVRLYSDDSMKWVKPINLSYCVEYKCEKSRKLYGLIESGEELDFEQGIALFEEIELKTEEDKYTHTYMKLSWIGDLISYTIQKDSRSVANIKKITENIIQNCEFKDLVINAIFSLRSLISIKNRYKGRLSKNCETYLMDLCFGCVENHFGYLPKLFTIMTSIIQSQHGQVWAHHRHAKKLKTIYVNSKNLIVKRLCRHDSQIILFVSSGLSALPSLEMPGNYRKEIAALHRILDIESTRRTDIAHISAVNHARAELFCAEGKFEETLECVNQFQEFCSTNFGSIGNTALANCYSLKVTCYIALGNKTMSKRALKKLKRLRYNPNVEEQITNFTKEIEKMPDVPGQEKENVRTRMACSFYGCKKVEKQIGDFKSCSACRLKYYCSRECQAKHWRSGHKKECKKCRPNKG